MTLVAVFLVFLGLLALAVAAPLAAVTITVVKRSYVRDWLRRLR